MRGLVLAAGRGSRLSAQTADRPKALIEVNGRSLFDRQVQALRASGATEVGVVAGWHAERFTDHCGRVFLNVAWHSGTMVDSLACADEWLVEEPVLVSYGDIVYSARTARRLAQATTPVAITYDPNWERLWRKRFVDPLTDAETFVRDDAGLLRDIGRRPQHLGEVQGQYMGLLKVTPCGWSEITRILAAQPSAMSGRIDMTTMLQLLVAENRMPVATIPTADPWFEFDQPSDLAVGREIVAALDLLAAPRSTNDLDRD